MTAATELPFDAAPVPGPRPRARPWFRPPLERALRPLVPQGLLGRTLLILLVPLLLLQGVALLLFYGGHLDVISRRLAGGVAGEVAMVAELMRREPPGQHGWVFDLAARRLDLGLAFEPGARLQPVVRPPSLWQFLPLERDLDRALTERVAAPFDTDWTSDPRSVIIRVGLPDGVLHVEAQRKRLFSATITLFVLWIGGSAIVLFGIAALFMKNQVRAIRRLAAAAEAFGTGRDVPPIKPEGAAEVRQAAAAFNRMRDRIRRFVAQRTDMLAGISHDLRTPLTRMRLALAVLPRSAASTEDLDALTEDVAEMERMVAGYLAFARGEATEQAEPADLVQLVETAAGHARRAGAQVAVTAPTTVPLPLRAGAIARCLGNLLDNARRHAGRIAVAVEAGPAWAQVTIDDDGPGIPAADREAAFRPFSTGAPGGTGLGLAIARDIVRAHGGELRLEASPLGGLRARLRLPV